MDGGGVAKYWDDHADKDSQSITCWEFPDVVQKYDTRRVTGDENLKVAYWFSRKYGPFRQSASIGCGTGILEWGLMREEGYDGEIIGLDISPGSIEQARARCSEWPNVRFQVADLNSYYWPRDAYDAVFAHGALHHIEKLDWLLSQVARSVRSHGFLYVNDYVGPQRFQWSDAQVRIATNHLLESIPERWIRSPRVIRFDPMMLADKDPSEACQSHFIEETIRAHFSIIERRPRGGALLAPIFGSGCIRESILDNEDGIACLRRLCEAESRLLEAGILTPNHLVIVAKPRK